MSVLEPIWQTDARVDFWVLFAKLILAEASSNQLFTEHQYGQIDAMDCSAVDKWYGIHQVFVSQMGLTMDDAGQ